MKIHLDRPRCESYGFCVEAAPKVFEFDENDDLVLLDEETSPETQVDVEAAVRLCPVAALSLEQ